LKRSHIRKSSWYQSIRRKVDRNDIPIRVFSLFEIEPPEQTSKIDKNTSFRNVETRTDTSASSEAEVVSFLNVGMIRAFSRGEVIVDISFWLILSLASMNRG
jgi:hypothetical protein